jgi:hypothetical protein
VLSSLFHRFGYQSKPRPFTDFLPFKETLAAAKAAGLSVGDYLERKQAHGARSARDQTMEGLAASGVFDSSFERVCEIGPGSGRYLERTVERCKPKLYEIYETSSEWGDWVVHQYGVQARICDGRTLSETESDSVDLAQAHRVFPGVPFLCTVSYFQEMARVVRAGGWVVFDIMTEACFSPEHLDAWFRANPWQWAWSPHMISREFTISMFADRGLRLEASFFVPLHPAITECMVFRKTQSKSSSQERA